MHEVTKSLVGGVRSESLNKVLLKLDDASGFGKPKDPREYWRKDNYVHVKS